MRSRLAVLSVLAVVAVTVAACGDDADAEPVEFGEGEIPAAFPDDLPLPADAVIGSTLIDRVNTRSEFEFRTAIDLRELTRFFSIELVDRGYVVDQSEGDTVRWGLDFRRGDVRGGIEMRSLGDGASQGVVEVNDS